MASKGRHSICLALAALQVDVGPSKARSSVRVRVRVSVSIFERFWQIYVSNSVHHILMYSMGDIFRLLQAV